MRKKIIVGIAAVAIVAAIALNINVAKSSNNLSDVFLANVEALANTDVVNGMVQNATYGWIYSSIHGGWTQCCVYSEGNECPEIDHC
jgi:hypothetical protein